MVRLPAFCVPFLRIRVYLFRIPNSEFRIFLQPCPCHFPRRFHCRGNRQRVHLVQRNKPIPLRRIRVGRVHLIQLHPPDLVREYVLRVPSGADIPNRKVQLRTQFRRMLAVPRQHREHPQAVQHRLRALAHQDFLAGKISSTSQSNGFGGFFCGSTGKSSASPASYASQCARSGQTSQFGVPGTQIAAPKSISA